MSARDKTLNDGDTGDFPVVWRETVEGITAEVCAEQESSEHADPRDCDNLGTMVCWHPDYYLGDRQIHGSRGAVKTAFETATGKTEFQSMRHLARYLTLALGAVVVIPLYLYDHSGISMSAGAPNPFDNPRVHADEFGQGLGWDTTMVGFIFATRERIIELCGEGKDGEAYCPADWDGAPLAWIAKQLDDEVKLYDRYLRGEVYYWRVEDADDEPVDSCGGYLPDVSVPYAAELDYVKQEAREVMLGEVKRRREAAEVEAVEAARAARMDIATVSA